MLYSIAKSTSERDFFDHSIPIPDIAKLCTPTWRNQSYTLEIESPHTLHSGCEPGHLLEAGGKAGP